MKKKPVAPSASTNLSPIQTALANAIPPAIVHHRGDLKKVTVSGREIHRQSHIWIEIGGQQRKIKCAPYDDHFIFRDPTVRMGWTVFCTCGAPAVVTGLDAYKQDASPQGALYVCYGHAQTGKHNAVNR